MKIKEGDKIPISEFYYLDESGAPKKNLPQNFLITTKQ